MAAFVGPSLVPSAAAPAGRPLPCVGPRSGGGPRQPGPAPAEAFAAAACLSAAAGPLAAARAGRATRRRGAARRAAGGVAVKERESAAAPAEELASRSPAALEPAALAEPEPAPIPMGATTVEGSGGEVLFAGGLTGGQSAFASYDYNFDPLGVSEKLPFAMPWFREAELKHGRIAMLAFLGLLGPEVTRLPGLRELAPACAAAGAGGELPVVEAHDACVAAQVPQLGLSPMWAILAPVFAIEVITTIMKLDPKWGGLTVENAGDYPMRRELGAALGQLPKNERAMSVIKLQELKHCRLAMIGFSGAWAQGLLTANGFPWWW